VDRKHGREDKKKRTAKVFRRRSRREKKTDFEKGDAREGEENVYLLQSTSESNKRNVCGGREASGSRKEGFEDCLPGEEEPLPDRKGADTRILRGAKGGESLNLNQGVVQEKITE